MKHCETCGRPVCEFCGKACEEDGGCDKARIKRLEEEVKKLREELAAQSVLPWYVPYVAPIPLYPTAIPWYVPPINPIWVAPTTGSGIPKVTCDTNRTSLPGENGSDISWSTSSGIPYSLSGEA